jgi:hypothetical protein
MLWVEYLFNDWLLRSRKRQRAPPQMLMDTLNTTVSNPQKQSRYQNLWGLTSNCWKTSPPFVDIFVYRYVSVRSRFRTLFEALRHLKYNKHELVLFHVYDKATEYNFKFENTPKRFVDVETGGSVDLYPDALQANYDGRYRNLFQRLTFKMWAI